MSEKTEDLPKLQAKVRLYRDVQGKAELLGFADLVIADAFVIKGIRIVTIKSNGDDAAEPFISFPSRKGTGAAQDKYFDVAHPITSEAHQRAKEVVLEAYQAAASQCG